MAIDSRGVYRPDFEPPPQLPWQQGMIPDQQVNIQPAASAFQDRFMNKGNGPAAPDHAQPEMPTPEMPHGLGPAQPDMPAHALGGELGNLAGGAAKTGLKSLAGGAAKMASL